MRPSPKPSSGMCSLPAVNADHGTNADDLRNIHSSSRRGMADAPPPVSAPSCAGSLIVSFRPLYPLSSRSRLSWLPVSTHRHPPSSVLAAP